MLMDGMNMLPRSHVVSCFQEQVHITPKSSLFISVANSGYAVASCNNSCFGRRAGGGGVSGFRCSGTEATLSQCGDSIQTPGRCMQHAGVLCCKLCWEKTCKPSVLSLQIKTTPHVLYYYHLETRHAQHAQHVTTHVLICGTQVIKISYTNG